MAAPSFDTLTARRGAVYKYADSKAVISNGNLKEACRQQGVAVEGGAESRLPFASRTTTTTTIVTGKAASV